MSLTGASFIRLELVIWATEALEYFRIDDPIDDEVPVPMVCGIWGTLWPGIFAAGAYVRPTPAGVDVTVSVKGLLYGEGTTQLVPQTTGSDAATIATFVVAADLMFVVSATCAPRVSRAGELQGLDLHEHGVLANRSTSFTGEAAMSNPVTHVE